jgi:pyridoxine/pyridoxamine 5'-phosphate oxidase
MSPTGRFDPFALTRKQHSFRRQHIVLPGSFRAATISLDGAPNVRTVLLQSASETKNMLTFHSDLRSQKIAELSRVPRIALVGVDTVHNLQVRVLGETRIIRDGQVRLDAWRSSPDHDLVAYRTRLAPGTPMNDVGDELDEAHVPGPGEDKRSLAQMARRC